MTASPASPQRPPPSELVQRYLRARNLEQLGRIDEAISLYEVAVAWAFDSAGPYDRLIALYAERASHREVIRVAQAALTNVRTHQQKRTWYEQMRTEAEKAQAAVPKAAAKRPRRRDDDPGA